MNGENWIGQALILWLGLFIGWFASKLWHGNDISAGEALPQVLRAYEQHMTKEQIAAAKNDVQLAVETAEACREAKQEGSRASCKTVDFLP